MHMKMKHFYTFFNEATEMRDIMETEQQLLIDIDDADETLFRTQSL